MALPMTLIIVTGEIDLSVASILGMSSALLGDLFSHGWPMPLVLVIVLVVGAIAGAFNGFLVTKVGLPSLAVTIGTLTLYRGIAVVILGPQTISTFPTRYTNIGVNAVPHTGGYISYSVLFFASSRSSSPSSCTRHPSDARCSSWARTRRPRATPASASSGRS